MAYHTEDMIKQSMDAIKKHNLMFIEDIIAYVPFSRQAFYDHNLDKNDTIKDSLNKNKIEVKNGLRAKWYKSDNATTQIALYKLIGTDDEADRLNASRQKVEHSGNIYKLTDEDRERYLKEIHERDE